MRLAPVVVVAMVIGGCEVKDAEYDRALRPEVGLTEQQVITAAGRPHRTLVADGFCKEAGGARELLYDGTVVFFGKEMIDRSVSLCIDGESKFILRTLIQIN